MTDRYNPLVHEVNATVRMGAHPDGGYVLASDYNLLVTEHEKTEAELADWKRMRNEAMAVAISNRARIVELESANGHCHEAMQKLAGRVVDLEAALRWTLAVIDPGAGPTFEDAYVRAQHVLAGTSTPPPPYTGSVEDSMDSPQPSLTSQETGAKCICEKGMAPGDVNRRCPVHGWEVRKAYSDPKGGPEFDAP